MSNTKKVNEKQKELYNTWIEKEKELQSSFAVLPDKTLSTRKVKVSKELFEKYKKLIKEASD